MDYSGKRVFVTGGDGFIGSHLVELLVRLGASVTALAQYNSFDEAGWLDDLEVDVRREVEVIRGDVRDPGQMDRVVAGKDIIFHLAALIAIPYSYAAPSSYVDVNVQGTVNLLEAARKHGTSRLIHTSTSEVYGTAQTTPIAETHPLQGQSPYSATKIGADMIAESFARSFGLPTVTLRPFNTYGPRQSERAVIPTIIRQALDPDCETIKLGDLSPVRDFNYVGDTAAAFAAIGLAKDVEYGQAYNAGSGRAVTIGEVLDLIRSLCGCEKPLLTEDVRKRPPNSEVMLLLADSRRLSSATGWRPETPLEEGLESTIAWWQTRLAGSAVRRSATYMV